MSDNFKEAGEKEDLRGYGGRNPQNENFVVKQLRGEYETWELLRCLNLADRVYFNHQK